MNNLNDYNAILEECDVELEYWFNLSNSTDKKDTVLCETINECIYSLNRTKNKIYSLIDRLAPVETYKESKEVKEVKEVFDFLFSQPIGVNTTSCGCHTCGCSFPILNHFTSFDGRILCPKCSVGVAPCSDRIKDYLKNKELK